MIDLPDHPFWDYSVTLYAKPGVGEACLRLQDGLGVDVNLLLFACWSATAGIGRPSRAGWQRLIDSTRPWRAEVVEPLRRVRRYLKDAPATPWSAGLRDRVKALELDAEHVAQLTIAALTEPDRTPPASALEAMLDYIGVLGIALSEADRADLSAIARQATQNVTGM